MFWLYLVLSIIGGLIVLLVILGFLSPRFAKMERSVEINSTKEKAFEQMVSMKNFVNNWSPWTDKDPNAKHTYVGNENAVGYQYSWAGDRKKVGSGSMTIREIVANEKVVSDLVFDGRGGAIVGIYVQDLGNGKIKVTWDFLGDNKNNPFGRLFGRFMDKFLGPDYEKGLSNLKSFLEKN